MDSSNKLIMRGKVITVAVLNSDLDSGSVVVLKEENKLEICTLKHLNPNG